MTPIRRIFWNVLGKHLFSFTPHNAYRYRTCLLKIAGMQCGKRVRARRNVSIDQPWNIIANDLVIFGDCVIVKAASGLKIGKRCVISQYSMLLTEIENPTTGGEANICGSITIEDDCWVATDSVVLPDSYIESGVVIGARSLVDGRLPTWSICTGEPATRRTQRVLRETP